MSGTPLTIDSPPAREPSRARKRWRLGWLIVAAIAFATYVYSREWGTQPLTLPDGRAYQVLNWDRHLSISITPDGQQTSEGYFWARYYSDFRDFDAMRTEARSLAPYLSQFADSLGYRTMKIEPAYPLLFRRVPLVVFSTALRFVRDSAGHWQEEHL